MVTLLLEYVLLAGTCLGDKVAHGDVRHQPATPTAGWRAARPLQGVASANVVGRVAATTTSARVRPYLVGEAAAVGRCRPRRVIIGW
jgi:hypothetical protein